jgi:uncharacterized membrane protein YkvA (DUF1232 family)
MVQRLSAIRSPIQGVFMRAIKWLSVFKFRRELAIAWRTFRHAGTPLHVKAMLLLAVLYVLSPIDLIPDVIPVLGWLDDIGVVATLLAVAQKMLPPEVWQAVRAARS